MDGKGVWRGDARSRGESWPRSTRKRNRGRVADTPILIAIYARLVVVVGVQATKGHAPRAAFVALKRFAEEESHRGSRIARLLLLALSLAPVAFQRRKRFTCLSTRIGFTRPAFVGIGAAIRVPAAIDGCETRTRSCSPIDALCMINMPWDTGVRAAAEGLVLKWFFIPSLISNLPPFRPVTDQIFIRLFPFSLSFSLFLLFVSAERRNERFRFWEKKQLERNERVFFFSFSFFIRQWYRWICFYRWIFLFFAQCNTNSLLVLVGYSDECARNDT